MYGGPGGGAAGGARGGGLSYCGSWYRTIDKKLICQLRALVSVPQIKFPLGHFTLDITIVLSAFIVYSHGTVIRIHDKARRITVRFPSKISIQFYWGRNI